MLKLQMLLGEIAEWCQSDEAVALCRLLEREMGGEKPSLSPESQALNEYLLSPDRAEENARIDAELRAQEIADEGSDGSSAATE